MSDAASAPPAAAVAAAVLSCGSSAAAEVTSAVADGIHHKDFWKDASKEWYGECIKPGDDAGKYHFQWSTYALSAPVRVTPNANGSTGWAWVLRSTNGKKRDNQIRVHKCANNPCTADWPANSGKYGKYPPPLHVQGCEAFAAVAAKPPPVHEETPPLPPPAEAPDPVVVEQAHPQPSPDHAKTLFCMQPAQPAAAISPCATPHLRREGPSSEMTPEQAAIQIAQTLLDLAREIRRPRAYVGYAVHIINSASPLLAVKHRAMSVGVNIRTARA